MDTRPFGTCFFEQYAQIALATFLGGEMTTLVNKDRPDLQLPDGLNEDSRMVRYRVLQEQRTAFYMEAIRRQNESE